ncbi:hypothetical protein AX13_01490 [Comamonas aquatica DA1877]|uniref:Uncharacterized protein n=1 Tax=Comamonas aquatica DA1877 TaxID=1457173 RepID=A0A014MED7_9BURK|nr:hypothetical protein AX13_01490 [Comamonas aquatica DA1877]
MSRIWFWFMVILLLHLLLHWLPITSESRLVMWKQDFVRAIFTRLGQRKVIAS